MAGRDKTNWERLSSKDVTDTVRYRDVYEQQQLDRRGAAHMQSPVPRTVAAVSLSVIVTVITWFLIAGIQWLIYAARVHASYIIPSSYGRLPFEASFVSFIAPDWLKVLVSLGVGLVVFTVLQTLLMRNLRAQNALADTSDINEYMNDQHIALPEEVQRKFDYFPDAGAHCSVSVSSMISHIALENKGIKRVEMVESQVDEDDDREFYDILAGDTSDLKLVKRPLIDEKFQDAIFETSGVPKKLRRAYDARRIPYNKGNVNRNKLKGYDTVADMINGDWELPLYEPQRPGGAYLVDTDPVNTMVLAITRAGKGQTIIEPTIDMWLREKNPNNIVVNDPKGELLVQFYVPAAVRGFQPVQLNLINAMKTDIYNPLIMAAQSAREGDSTKCAAYVENIADVFFPQTEGEDPVWSNSANNAFKRAAYGLIDFFLEEEVKMRGRAARGNVATATLENEVDTLWGRVTLYNCYQLFVQLTSRKRKNPYLKWQQKAKDAGGTYNAQNEAEERQIQLDQKMGELVWNGEKELDELTLFFNATSRLPRNSIRTLVANADNALRAMGGADKMIASVYGIALTAMSFFADPTISTLTSGTPSQNIDLAGLSFPRRIGVQFHQDFMRRYHLVGLQCRWQAYSDPEFKNSLGEDFYHQDSIGREGWARMYFKGIFPENEAYLKLEIRNASTGGIVKKFFFKFTKSYQVSLDGRYYVTDPVLDEKIIKNGVLEELVERKREDGSVEYVSGKRAFNHKQLVFDENAPGANEEGMVARPQPIPAITSNYVRYSEKPKIVFMITPPHLAKYAKLLLIIIKELTNLNFEQSYMTKSNQKPLYMTRFMLDELGNLQSEGHGISNFETMLSIGLGQGQQFHCILQTLAQLTSVYGDSVDSIVQGNTSNIVFLKSTDSEMLEKLEKMSGKKHESHIDQKMVSRNEGKVWMRNEGVVSYTMSTTEMPVISYNDMAFIPERNSIVFRAGDSPIWNRNETVLPMSWRLLSANAIRQPGKEYSLQTIPTLSSAIDFDIRKNQPDFHEMLELRMEQACLVDEAEAKYRELFGMDEFEITQLDPDVYAAAIMEIVDALYERNHVSDGSSMSSGEGERKSRTNTSDEIETNNQFVQAARDVNREMANRGVKRYLSLLSQDDLVNAGGAVNHQFDQVFITTFRNARVGVSNDDRFSLRSGELFGGDASGRYAGKPFITFASDSERVSAERYAQSPDSRVYSENEGGHIDEVASGMVVSDDFYRFMASLNRWDDLWDGKFKGAFMNAYDE